jgi:acyl-CoA synthetase (AMP-forming)/AMP-acid ligase II
MFLQDSVSVENSLYSDPRVYEVAAVGVPDERLGEQVAAVVSVKPAYQGRVTEAELIALSRRRYSSYKFSHGMSLTC